MSKDKKTLIEDCHFNYFTYFIYYEWVIKFWSFIF